MRIAWDVSEHFRDNWHQTPYKAQLVAQDKATALLYKHFLDEFSMVSSEVLISGPDDREGEEDVHEESKDVVKDFWKKMMAKYAVRRNTIARSSARSSRLRSPRSSLSLTSCLLASTRRVTPCST